MRHLFAVEQWLPRPVPEVFAFFADPANLPRLMPEWQAARIESIALVPAPGRPEGSPGRVAAGAGTRMTLSFRPVPLSPLRLRWDAEIAEFVWDEHFCDVQLRRGPFASWRHCHRVRAERRDEVKGTVLRDEVEYELPFGALGEAAHRLGVRRQIEAAFRYRHRRTAELLGGSRVFP